LTIDDGAARKPVRPGDRAVTFDVRLPTGAAELPTWFCDSDGRDICGAPYVEVLR